MSSSGHVSDHKFSDINPLRTSANSVRSFSEPRRFLIFDNQVFYNYKNWLPLHKDFV
ncbi:Uncharacterized protein dnm_013250 [Desulfonema magnum]|uniref:Uncharacterized protein n=1 Tax=Desulfonema magnum TaxID=45655 RepID=A0A975GL88_9BACT|nr:Uncharacterized protein dnm_013250 [Desulfonema magnum]